jgi:hypothetical protein
MWNLYNAWWPNIKVFGKQIKAIYAASTCKSMKIARVAKSHMWFIIVDRSLKII